MGRESSQGRLWGAGAEDYAELFEPFFRSVYMRVFIQMGIGPGKRLLDIGCGPGLAAQVAAICGAEVAGIDAAAASLAIARCRTPAGDFREGDAETLPWPAGSFDLVTGFNIFQFTPDPFQALQEVRRVLVPGGRLGIVLWAEPERCETAATVLAAVEALLPPSPAPHGPWSFARENIHTFLNKAGLNEMDRGDIPWSLDYPDLNIAVRGFMSVGLIVDVAEQVGTEPVRQAIVDALAPFRTSAGRYRQQNEFRFHIAAPAGKD